MDHNFLTDIIDRDRAAGLHEGRVRTRFPPEPNGYLHIGHAKSICLNFGLALRYGGTCNLRYDDTNPSREEQEYVDAIARDVRWLGFTWDGEARFASDYFGQMYRWAEELVRMGKAYVDSQSIEEVRERRGRYDRPGEDSPFRERSIEENLDLVRRMRAGEFPDGAHTLRARIDMAHPNMLMRDPLLYRIKHERHHRAGDDWCIYPMYDYAHCLEDAIEGVTHSICTLEFESNRELYDWLLDTLGLDPRPHQYEFARLSLDYTLMSKRKLLVLVEEGVVEGWDDPRMPTIAGLRRRGITPEAIRAFADMIGVAKKNSTVDIAKLEFCIRADLNHRAPRVMGVLDPLPVTITNWPAGTTDTLDASYWPHDVPKEGSRPILFGERLFIERGDFALEPPSGWRRLSPGAEVRLRYGYVIRCDEVITDPDSGEVLELRCSADLDSRGGSPPDGRKVAGTLHWVAAEGAVPARVRLYDRLFSVEQPGADPDRDFHEDLNPSSLLLVDGAVLEASLATAKPGERYQLERQGYFFVDPIDNPEGGDGPLVLHRIITLRDSWAKKTGDAPTSGRPSRSRKGKEEGGGGGPKRSFADQLDALLEADEGLAAFRAAAHEGAAADATPDAVDRVLVGELPGLSEGRPVATLPLEGAAFGRVVGLAAADVISSAGARKILAELVSEGGDPEALVDSLGLRQVSDEGALGALVDSMLGEHPDEAERLLAGEKRLLGFFIGATMRASGGSANPQAVRELLTRRSG